MDLLLFLFIRILTLVLCANRNLLSRAPDNKPAAPRQVPRCRKEPYEKPDSGAIPARPREYASGVILRMLMPSSLHLDALKLILN